MSNDTLSTRDRLAIEAARLFRQKGFHGVGLAEILAAAQVPKGSLYHHFPNGKSDLALAASDWASEGMLRIIDDAFVTAPSFADGVATLCHKLAKFFDISHHWDGCPVSGILFESPDNDLFRRQANMIYDRWIDRVAGHGQRLGLPAKDARYQADRLMLLLQGGWIMARARQSSDVIRTLPDQLWP